MPVGVLHRLSPYVRHQASCQYHMVSAGQTCPQWGCPAPWGRVSRTHRAILIPPPGCRLEVCESAVLHRDASLQDFPWSTFPFCAAPQLRVGSASRHRARLRTHEQLAGGGGKRSPPLQQQQEPARTHLCMGRVTGSPVPPQGDLGGNTGFKQSPKQLLPFLYYSKIKGALRTWEVKGLY